MQRTRIGIVAKDYVDAANQFAEAHGRTLVRLDCVTFEHNLPEYKPFEISGTQTVFRVSRDPDGTYYVWVP